MRSAGARPDRRALPDHLRPRLTAAERAACLECCFDLYRGGRFFEAHEEWETVWRSTTPEPRELLQALIQITVAFHHLRARGRPDVAARMFRKAARRLEVEEEEDLGLDRRALRRAVLRAAEACEARVDPGAIDLSWIPPEAGDAATGRTRGPR